MVAQWITTYLVTMILGFDNAGILSLAMSLSNSFSTFALYGMRSFQVSDTLHEHNNKTYICSRIFTCTIAIVACVSFVLISGYDIYTKVCIVSYMIYKLSEAIVDVYHGIDQINMRMDIIGKSFVLRGIASTVLFLITIISTGNLLLGILSLIIVSYLFIILYDKTKSNQFNDNKSTNILSIKKLMITCLPFAIYSFIFTLLTTIPRFFLEKEVGANQLGIYASVALPVIIVQVLATYIFNPFISLFAVYINNHNYKSFKKLFIKIIVFIIGLSVVSIVGALLLGDFGLHILFGNKIVGYEYLLIPLVWCTILTAFVWFLSTIVIVIRNYKSLLIAGFSSVIVCTCASSIFIKQFGLNGASYITILSLLVQLIIMSVYLYIFYRKNSKT